MLAAPPWMKISSGYFFVGSNAGGRKIMLWIFLPRLLTNQKWRGGSQSVLRAAVKLNADSVRCRAFGASMRTTSAGMMELPHSATITGAFSEMARLVYT